MGIYDRDYIRSSPRGGFGSFSMMTVTTWLIIINVAVFLLDQMLGGNQFHVGPLTALGCFAMPEAVQGLQFWRFITFQFLHANISHIFFNMLSLYFFGPMMEAYLGPRRYLAYYLICGIAGGVSFMLLTYLGIIEGGFLVGASAGIFGILIGAARFAPDARVMLMFPPIPMSLKTMAWVFVAIAAYTVFTSGYNAGGEAAHLGGAVVGFLLIRNERLLDFVYLRRPRMSFGGRRAQYKDWSKDYDR
jgi:membrane associated rhomboid family serine protease